MKKRTLIQTIALGLALGTCASAMAQATWKPTKPINLIVPWAAGGSTDQITRIAAAEIEKTLGQKIVGSTSLVRLAQLAAKTLGMPRATATPGPRVPLKTWALTSPWEC